MNKQTKLNQTHKHDNRLLVAVGDGLENRRNNEGGKLTRMFGALIWVMCVHVPKFIQLYTEICAFVCMYLNIKNFNKIHKKTRGV